MIWTSTELDEEDSDAVRDRGERIGTDLERLAVLFIIKPPCECIEAGNEAEGMIKALVLGRE